MNRACQSNPAMVIVVGLVLASCATERRQGQPVTPQRPTLSSDTSTTAEGTIELEAGGSLQDGGSASTPVTIKYGVRDGFEVFASSSPLLVLDGPSARESGVGDLYIGTRARLLDETDERPALALQPALKLPTADEDRGLGSGEFDLQLAGIASKSVGEWVLVAFAELDLLGDPAGGVTVGQSLALAGSRPVTDRLAVFAEVAGVLVAETDSENVFSTMGVAYAVEDYLVLDGGIVLGLSDEANDFALVFGLTRNFGRMAQ